MNRRWFIKCLAASASMPMWVGATPVVSMSGPLAGSLYFTRDEPGIWFSDIDRHLPRIEISGAPGDTTSVTIMTPHPMEGCKHYIVRHKLLDARFRLLSQKTFDPTRDQPVSRHVLAAGYQGPIYGVSICNLHDAWIEGVMV